MNEHPLPMFDEQPAPAIDAPKKARRKPMKRHLVPARAQKRGGRVISEPKPAKKRRKRRTVKKTTLVASDGSMSRVGHIIGAHAQMEHILSTLTKKERAAMLEHLKLADVA